MNALTLLPCQQLEKQIAELIGRRLENVEKVNGLSRKLFEARRAAFVNELKALSVAEEIQKHKDVASAAAQLANEALSRLNIIAQELEVLKELYADAKSKCQPLTDEDKEEIPHLSDDVDVLEAEIESRIGEIEALGIPTDRRREIEQTNARIAVLDDKLGNGQGVMEAHHAKLDAMKVSFSSKLVMPKSSLDLTRE
jgi:chromosome segregation ATPase